MVQTLRNTFVERGIQGYLFKLKYYLKREKIAKENKIPIDQDIIEYRLICVCKQKTVIPQSKQFYQWIFWTPMAL